VVVGKIKVIDRFYTHIVNIKFLYTAGSGKDIMPSYGELIDLYTEKEVDNLDVESFCSNFRELYPEVPISRPQRFLETVQRIVAPTRPSIIRKAPLCGSPLTTPKMVSESSKSSKRYVQ